MWPRCVGRGFCTINGMCEFFSRAKGRCASLEGGTGEPWMRGRGPGEELRPAISPMQSRSGGRTQLSEGLLVQDQGIVNVEEEDGRRGTLGALREIAYEILWHKDDASEYRRPALKAVGHIVEVSLLACIIVSTGFLMFDSFDFYDIWEPQSHCWDTCCLPTGKCTLEVCELHKADMGERDKHCRLAHSFGETRDGLLWIVTLIFTIEYCLRFWACVEDPSYDEGLAGRLKWAKKPMSILDLLSVAPFYVIMAMSPAQGQGEGSPSVFRVMRLMRIVSVLRVERTVTAWRLVVTVFKRKGDELMVVMFVACIFILLAASLMYYIENDHNSEMFPHIPGSMWWAVNCIATIGYGDVYRVAALHLVAGPAPRGDTILHPIQMTLVVCVQPLAAKTAVGRIVGSLVAFVGIGLFALPAGILGAGFSEASDELKRERRVRRLARSGGGTGGQSSQGDPETPGHASFAETPLASLASIDASGRENWGSALEHEVGAGHALASIGGKLEMIEKMLSQVIEVQARQEEMIMKLHEDKLGSSF